MKRRNFLAGLAVTPVAMQNIVEHPTETQLLGLTEEEYQRGAMPGDSDSYDEEQAEADREYDGSGYAGPNAHQFASGKTQRQAALHHGWSTQYYSDIERGARLPITFAENGDHSLLPTSVRVSMRPTRLIWPRHFRFAQKCEARDE